MTHLKLATLSKYLKAKYKKGKLNMTQVETKANVLLREDNFCLCLNGHIFGRDRIGIE